MKFNNFDQLIEYLFGKDFSKLNFEIEEEIDNPVKCDGDCSANNTTDKVNVTFSGLSDNPEQEFVVSNESYLLVEDYDHMPNTCSASKVSVFGKELFMTICEDINGNSLAKMNVIVNGNLITNKEFILTKDKSIGNQIKL